MEKEKKENPEFYRFQDFTKRLVKVPKDEIDEKEREVKQKGERKKD